MLYGSLLYGFYDIACYFTASIKYSFTYEELMKLNEKYFIRFSSSGPTFVSYGFTFQVREQTLSTYLTEIKVHAFLPYTTLVEFMYL